MIQPRLPRSAALSARASRRLVEVVAELSQARTLAEITAVVRVAARELTGADGATFVLRDGERCYYVDEDAIAPLWKGQRFPMSACISGWVMQHAQATAIRDIYEDERIPADAYRPTFVRSLAMVPIRRERPLGAIGNYWASLHQPSAAELALLQALADTTAVAIHNAQLATELEQRLALVKEHEERIRSQAQALQVFTRAMAHDLKEPVRAVRSLAQMLVDDELPCEARPEYLRLVRDAGERMGVLLEAVSRYTQLEDEGRAPRERVDLGDVLAVVRASLGELLRGRGATLSAEALPTLHAQRMHLTRAFHELVANALQHGGTQVRVDAAREEGRWVIRVRDDGPGVPAARREEIFEPFKRLTHDEARAGLGLASCRKIVEQHGGTIECEPSEHGACFAVRLPADEPRAPATTELPGARPAALEQAPEPLATVLLVDDREADILLSKLKLFGRKGVRCELLVARDGQEALSRIAAERGGGREVDLVLLDINMPVMDGFQVLQQIRADTDLRTMPVVMCTGSTHEDDLARARDLGATGYLCKPPSLAELRSILDGVASLKLLEHADQASALVRSA